MASSSQGGNNNKGPTSFYLHHKVVNLQIMILKVEEEKSDGLFILQTTSSKPPLPFNHLPLQKKLLIVKDKDMSLKKNFLWIFLG